MMAGIRGSDTRPELLLRTGLHRLGFRYRLHVRSLPGKPDIVLPKHNAVLFANGCFWHGHGCHLFKWPQTRADFWRAKIAANQRRDAIARRELNNAGWRVGVVWECALKGKARLPADKILETCAAWLCGERKTLELKGGMT